MLCAIVMVVCCWLGTHGKTQLWGNSNSGRYSTDWNGCSAQCMTDAEEALFRNDPWVSEVAEDQILGAVLLKASSMYHALALLDEGQRRQYQFWEAVFGTDCLHGSLYFFSVQAVVLFKKPVDMPVTDRRKLKTFFSRVDLFSPDDLVKQLREESGGAPLPDWVDSKSHVVMRLPAAHSFLVAREHWTSVCLPDPSPEHLFSVGVRQRSRMMGWSHIPDLADQFVVPEQVANFEQPQMSGNVAEEIADTIRKMASRLNPNRAEDAALLDSAYRAAYMMQRMRDELHASDMHRRVAQSRGRVCTPRLPFQASFIIQCLLLGSHLRDVSNLKKVLLTAVNVALPKIFAEAVVETIRSDPYGLGLRVPSPSKITRARLSADVALMLHRRDVNRTADESGGCVRYVMVDSSVQGHYDFELVRITSIKHSDCKEMFLHAMELHNLWSPYLQNKNDELLQETASKEAELHAVMFACIDTHLSPAVVVGHSRLYHKFHATAHCFFLETGSAVALEKFGDSIFAFTTDQGTEAGLHKVPPVLIRKALPFVAYEAAPADDHDFAPPLQNQADLEAKLDFGNSVGIAGMLHIIHNSTNDLGRSMVTFDATVKQLSHISKLLCRRDSKQRLLETCFSDRVGRHLQSDIKSFRAKLDPSRWGSFAHCVTELLEIEATLRYGWNLNSYGDQRANAPEDDGGHGVDLAIVNSALTSPDFWATLRMMRCLANVINSCLTWVETCPCHHHLERSEFPKRVVEAWRTCPLGGCKAPELAAGEFRTLLGDLHNVNAAELLSTLPRDISPESRAAILQEFERGRAHLVFVLNLRLAHWRDAPYCVFGCAHLSPEVSKRFLRRCLDMSAGFPLVARLQQPPLRDEAEQYLDGADIKQLPNLLHFLGTLRYCPIAERAVEGDHAQAV